jgi:signal transduction histidine kinase
VAISTQYTIDSWWERLRPRFTLLYFFIALALLVISATGHGRVLSEVGRTFGGFFWAIDTDGQVVVVSTPAQLPPFEASASSLTSVDHIVKVNGQPATTMISTIYQHARPGENITYTIQHNATTITIKRPASVFTMDMWVQNYGLSLIAGLSWLLVGAILLARSREWVGAVEGITLFPPAMLFLLYSHWGNVQQAYPADLVFQLLWVPSFALLGAAFIHLSLTYRTEALSTLRHPRLVIDGLPYVPLIVIAAFEWCSYLIAHQVPTRINLLISLGYAALGGIVSFAIGIYSLLRISPLSPKTSIPPHIRHRLSDLLILWIGGLGLGFCLGILPILLTGQTFLPLQIFYVLAAAYPLLLLYAIRSLRLIDQLHLSLAQRETALQEQRRTAEELRQANRELKKATSLLLHADAHLRSLLSQRIHDQPKQQALRIRSLLGHWQHKLNLEAGRDSSGKVEARPIIEALGKVRKISEELEDDLRGLQLLVEDVYQRQSLGLKLHLEKLIREDLPALHAESPLNVRADLQVLDMFNRDLEQTEEGAKIAEAISYTVTQALLNVYNHAGASFTTVRAVQTNGHLEVYIIDDGRGYDPNSVPPEKTSMFKAELKAREAGGTLVIHSAQRPQVQHGTTVILTLPMPQGRRTRYSGPVPASRMQTPRVNP